MIRTLAALDGLRGEPENIRRDPIHLRIDARKECAGLLKALETLRTAGLRLKVSRPPLNPKEVWKHWEAHGFDLEALDGLQIRSLCTAEETALEPTLLEALERHPEVLRRSICLFGIVVTYFSKWRAMASPERVERLIKKVLLSAERPSSIVGLWQLHAKLFSEDAANYLAQEIVRKKAKLGDVLADKLVPVSSALSLAVSGSVAEVAATNFRQNERALGPEQKMTELQWIVR